MNILIAFYSGYQHTQLVADALAAGAQAATQDEGTPSNIITKQAADVSLEDMRVADVLIFGTPVHMGSMAWQMKQLIDEGTKLWNAGELEHKIGGAFTTFGGLGGAGGGVENTLISLHANFLQHGMLVCGYPRTLSGYADAGSHWGLAVRTGNDEGMPEGVNQASLAAARAYGAHVIETALQFK